MNVFTSESGKQAILSGYRTRLERLTVPHQIRELSTSLGRTFMIASGPDDAPPMILLHGSGSNAIMWTQEIENFAADYRVYAVDIPGEPGFSEELQADLESESYTRWLHEVMTGLQLRQVILIGLSLGGFLAVKYALAHPDMVSRLVLISPSGIGRQRKSFLLRAIGYSLSGKDGVEKLYRKISEGQQLSPETMTYLLTLRNHFSYRTGKIPVFTDRQLQALTMPVAIFAGTDDIMLDSRHTIARLTAAACDVTVYSLEGRGHAPGPQCELIREFLKQI